MAYGKEKKMAGLAAVILGAGKSTRMKSETSKVMHLLAGRPLITYPIEAAKKLRANPILVVAGPDQDDVKREAAKLGIKLVVQKNALGTGHAVLQTRRALQSFRGHVLVLCGDAPLIRRETLELFVREVRRHDATCGVLTMELKNPGSYGRIIRDLDGQLVRIVEAKDAGRDDLKVREVNSGIFCVEKKWLFETLHKIEPKNHQKEYYLTDIAHHAISEGKRIVAFKGEDAKEFLGVNTRVDLALAIAAMRDKINNRHMMDGVSIMDPTQTYIDADVRIGNDTTIWPGTFIMGRTVVGSNCTIENGVVLKNVRIENGVHIKPYSVVEDSSIATAAIVGPFSRIRPASKIGKNVRIGNFVEVKKSDLKEGAKANHLTYLGDAYVGPRVNVGCGTITCNYDGRAKYRTIIGEGVFIGSDVQFVAPVTIGKGATIGAGSTITKNVPPKALALTRAPQVIVKNWKPKKKTSR